MFFADIVRTLCETLTVLREMLSGVLEEKMIIAPLDFWLFFLKLTESRDI